MMTTLRYEDILPAPNLSLTGTAGDGRIRFGTVNGNHGTFYIRSDEDILVLGRFSVSLKSGSVGFSIGKDGIEIYPGADGVITVGIQKWGQNSLLTAVDVRVKT